MGKTAGAPASSRPAPLAPAVANLNAAPARDAAEDATTHLMFWRPPCVRRRVIVNLKHTTDEGLRGVLWSYAGGWLVLRDVAALVPGQNPTKVDGEIVVHRDTIAYLQVLP